MLFDSFPPVLQIQLRRFEYDFVRDIMVKVKLASINAFLQSLLFCFEIPTTLSPKPLDEGL